MKRTICLLVGVALVGLASAQDEPRSTEALEILKKVDAAAKAVAGVRYKSRAEPGGVAVNFVGPSAGEGVMFGWNGTTPERFYVHVKTRMPGSDEEIELTGGGNGDTFFIIDHKNKKAYEDMDPAVMGSGARALRGAGMVEFVHDRPFDDELNAEVVELQGAEKVGETECYKIRVVYSGGQAESTWYFSKKDYLPRRRIRHFTIPDQGEGTLQVDISELEVNPEVSPALFQLKLPEGYEQIDDFMP
jgi:hypothetical protein